MFFPANISCYSEKTLQTAASKEYVIGAADSD